MAEELVKVRTGLVPDPDKVPVVYSNVFGGGGIVGSVINFTLVVSRFTPTFEGPIDNDPIVAARIRIDRDAAVQLRNFLNTQIELLTTPKEKAN